MASDRQKLPLGMIVGRMLHDMFKVFRKRINESSEIKLTIEQFGLLYRISICSDYVIQQDMAYMLGKDKSSILRLIDSLEKQGLIRRMVEPHDRRKKCLVVTDLGHKVIHQYLDIEFALGEELLAGLSGPEIETFHHVVRTIQKNAEEL